MSGGHFDYKDFYFEDIASTLENDVLNNLIPYDIDAEDERAHGYQLSDESLTYIRTMVGNLRMLRDLLHTYDYMVSGDSSEDRFLIIARAMYKGEC